MWQGLVASFSTTCAALHSLCTSLYLFLSQAGYFARDSHAMLGFRRSELIESVEATPVCARWHFLWVNLQKILAAAQLMQSVRNAVRPSLSCQSLLDGFTEALLGYKESSGKGITIPSILKPCTEILSEMFCEPTSHIVCSIVVWIQQPSWPGHTCKRHFNLSKFLPD